MRLLLDTHIALWAILDHPKLSRGARVLIEDAGNFIAISVASIWEISIKHALGRGEQQAMPISGSEALTWFRQAGYFVLAISAEHAAAVETLADHHGDPFDRILIAQSLIEPYRLLTRDALLASYSDTVIVA